VDLLFLLARDYGLPIALLIVAVVVIWRQWLIERKLRDRDRNSDARQYRQLLKNREEELHDLYKDQALENLRKVINREKKKRGK